MQIIHAEVIPVELKLSSPVRMAKIPPIEQITAFFVHLETRESLNAWGCAVAHPDLTGETPHHALLALQRCVDLAPDLHPTNIELSLARLEPFTRDSLAARCAFDLAFHDLLGLAAGLPLYRLLGGYRNMIQTSATIPLATVEESVELAAARARFGFRLLKNQRWCRSRSGCSANQSNSPFSAGTDFTTGCGWWILSAGNNRCCASAARINRDA